jgi:hypothetical protein
LRGKKSTGKTSNDADIQPISPRHGLLTGRLKQHMKKYYGFVFLLMTLFYGSCAAIETIFKAGMYWGIFLVILVVALIFFLIRKLFR